MQNYILCFDNESNTERMKEDGKLVFYCCKNRNNKRSVWFNQTGIANKSFTVISKSGSTGEAEHTSLSVQIVTCLREV